MAKTSEKKRSTKTERVRLAKQLGLVHPPGRVKSTLQRTFNLRVSKKASLALAKVRDFVVKALLDDAYEYARIAKTHKDGTRNVVSRRIIPKDIRLARDNDPDSALLRAFPGIIAQTGFAKFKVKTGADLAREKAERKRAERAELRAQEDSDEKRKRKAAKAKAKAKE